MQSKLKTRSINQAEANFGISDPKRMKARSLICAVAILVASGCANGSSDPYRTLVGPAFVLATERAEDFFVSKSEIPKIAVRINGVSGLFMIDTGANVSALSQTYARRLGLSGRPGKDRWVRTTVGRSLYSTDFVSDIALGELKISKSFVVIVPDLALGPPTEDSALPEVEGLIGADILMRFRSTIDFAAHTIVFHKPDQKIFPKAEEFVVARLEVDSRAKTIIMKVSIDGVDGWFEIDTGANHYGSIFADSKFMGILREVSNVPYNSYAGGHIQIISTHLAGGVLKIGDFGTNTGSQFTISKKTSPKLRYAKRYIDGYLGSTFFLQNELIIDYARMEVRRRGISVHFPEIGQKETADNRTLVEQPR